MKAWGDQTAWAPLTRIQYDLYSIDNGSLWFDLRILALTLWHILTSRNAR